MSIAARSTGQPWRHVVLRPGLRIDRLGDVRVVLDPSGGVIHTLRGELAETLDGIVRGERPGL